MSKLIRSLAALLFMVALSCKAHASIAYISDNRFIDHSLNAGGAVAPSPAFSDFNSSLEIGGAGAFQNTILNSSVMSGNGSTYARDAALGNGADATSNFSVTFSVDELTDFSLTGSIETHWYLASSIGVSLQVDGVTTNFFSFTDSDVSGMGVSLFSFDGQFSPDKTYVLDLWSYAAESGDFNQDWTFNLTTTSAVPVPASIWLLGSGLIGLLTFARRKIDA